MVTFRHIVLPPVEHGERFQPEGFPDTARPTEVPNRREHAENLRRDLSSLKDSIELASQQQTAFGLDESGVAALAELRAEAPLPFEGRRPDTKRGAKLLGFRRIAPGRDAALIRLDEAATDGLLRGLDKYTAWRRTDKKRPQNFWLFESLASFRLAKVEDLWTDPSSAYRAKQVPFSLTFNAWLRADTLAESLRCIEVARIQRLSRPTQLPGVAVIAIRATHAQLETMLRLSGGLLELRGASELQAGYASSDTSGSSDAVSAIVGAIKEPDANSVRIAVLDTGVHHRHPLLERLLPEDRCFTIEPDWKTEDHAGHGTQVCGLAAIGDLNGAHSVASKGASVPVQAALESIKVLRPADSNISIPPHVAIESAVRLVDAPPHRRVFCLASTVPKETTDGSPSETSTTIDSLCWNDGNATRLFCVAAGNVPVSNDLPYDLRHYGDRNRPFPLESPGQSVNAITVGAMTSLESPDGRKLVAPAGDLSPLARTAEGWSRAERLANKPDVVFEGGNHFVASNGLTSQSDPKLRIATTGHRSPIAYFADTSAATAAVSGIAAGISAAYPSLRPETVRGLLVHSARWTPAMLSQATQLEATGMSRPDAWALILDRFGWGVPSLDRAIASSANVLTLITEDKLTPLRISGSTTSHNEMKYYELPWPRDQLLAIGQETVSLRCTLSYYAEPYILSRAARRRKLYFSHRLGFDLKAPNDTHVVARGRINSLAEAPSGEFVPDRERDEGWTVGSQRRWYGTLLQDVWQDKAHRLAERNGIAIFPIKGWWADTCNQRGAEDVRYSLIVTLETPRLDIDLRTEVLAKIAMMNPAGQS